MWLEELRDVADLDLGDHFTFNVARTGADLSGPPEGGVRLRVEARLDRSQPYVTFVIDLGRGDALLNRPESLSPSVDLGFAGLTSPGFPSYPLPEHFAEKLYAYTRPRPHGERTRVKDLVDLSLLIEDLGLPPGEAVRQALEVVFARYASHPLPRPREVPPPPPEWTASFVGIARELGHDVMDAGEAHARLTTFLTRCWPNEESVT